MKKLYNKFIAISLMLIAEISVVEAQSNENSIEPRVPLAKNYTITNGLPSNEVYQTIQDKKGLIWFCTDKGVVSFNGSKFKVYDKSDGLKENSVLRSKKDENENLWFFTINDFVFKIQDSVYTHPYKKLLVEKGYKLSNFRLRDFTFYKDTLHLLCSRPWKSSYYIKATNDFVQVKEITETQASIIKIKVGNSYLVSLNYNFKGTESFFYEKNKKIILTGNPYHNKWLKESNTLFEAWRIEYNLGTSKSYYSIDNVLFSFNDSKYHHEFENEIYSIWQYANNIYLSQPNYILEQNLSSKRSTQLFKGKRPCSITADLDNNLWITTLNHGVFFIPNSKSEVIFCQPENEPDLTIVSNFENDYLFGQKNGLIKNYNQTTQTAALISCFDKNEPVNSITRVYGPNYLLAYSGNTYLFNPITNQCEPRNLGTSPNFLHKINGGLFFGIRKNTGGLSLISKDLKLLYKSLDKSNPNNPIEYRTYFTFYDSLNSRVLISTAGGIYSFNPADTSTQKAEEFEFLNNSIVSCIDRKSHLFAFGTQGEGAWLKSREKIIQTKGKLRHTHVNCIKLVDTTTIAVGTNNGLYLLKLENDSLRTIKHLDNSNALIGNSVAQIDINANGEILVLTNRALIKIPSIPTEKDNISELIFNGFHIKGEKPIIDTVLNIGNNKGLFARFSAINFLSSNSMIYGYRIHPLSNKWIFKQDPFIDLSAYRPGSYEIEFAAFNELSKFKISKTQHLILNVEKPIYMSLSFIIIMAITGIIFATLIGRLVVARVKKQAQVQTQLVEVEAQALRTQMNPHFFFNTLNSIQNFIALNDKKQAYNYISKFAHLVRTYLKQTNLKDVPLRVELETLKSYIDLEKMRLDHSFEYQFNIDDKISERIDGLQIPAMLLQPVAENAIMHGLRNIKHEGLLTIDILDNDDYFLIKIKDNGIGIAKAKALRKIKKTHESLGLKNIYRRVELINSLTPRALFFSLEELEGEQTGAVATFKLSYYKYER